MNVKQTFTFLFILIGFLGYGQVQDTTKKVNFAFVPLVNYSSTLGIKLGTMGQLYYKVNQNDAISPSSSTGLGVMYTTNNSYFLALFQRLYLNEDRWRFLAATGLGNFNYQYWQDLPFNSGGFIGFGTGANFGFLRMERKVYKQLYVGAIGIISKNVTDYDIPDFFPDSLKTDERNMNCLGYLINFDRREHQVNPYGGYNIELKNTFYRTWMNSGNNFENVEFTYNHFYQIKNERNILATRVKAAIATGDVPFQGQSVVGQDDIRGYTKGKYRANQVYAVQAEYRWRFHEKMGMVGFAGLASAVDQIGDVFNSEILPGAGVGFRYMMIPKERINVGFDVAKGKGDWGLYFRIGESFGR
ncbi:MAG: BamA/TamA family outer membrane protein [Draconibacterium sp.]